jgi:preprotein translocase subunit SecG
MAYFLLVLIVIVSILLGVVILVQNPKGGGLAMGFQGAGSIGGVQRTADFMEKATWYLLGALFVLSIVAGIVFGNMTQDVGIDESVLPTATEQAPAAPLIEGEPEAGEAPPVQEQPAP